MRLIHIGILLVCTFGCTSALAQQKTYFIIASDSISADIRDCTNVNAMIIKSAILENFPSGTVRPIELRGRDCTAERIKQEFRRIPNPQSASVFFYYCGHGFSTRNNGASILFPTGQRSETAENLYQVMEARSPRLFVSVLDCCSCLLYTSPSPRDATLSRMPSSA